MSLKEGGAYFGSNSMLGGSRLFQVIKCLHIEVA